MNEQQPTLPPCPHCSADNLANMLEDGWQRCPHSVLIIPTHGSKQTNVGDSVVGK